MRETEETVRQAQHRQHSYWQGLGGVVISVILILVDHSNTMWTVMEEMHKNISINIWRCISVGGVLV